MARRTIWGIAIGIACLFVLVVFLLIVVPRLVYPPLSPADLSGIAGSATRVQLQQAQGQLQNDLRSTLLQVTGGLVVVSGAFATWRQVDVNREGQITERFTRAVEQLGSDKVDVRIGGIYALERIARNSAADRYTIQFVLGAYIRNHAPWHVGLPTGPEHPTATIEPRPSLRLVAPDIQTAVAVLARRLPPEAGTPNRLYLSRVDLRGLEIFRGRLVRTYFEWSNLAGSQLSHTRLDRSVMTSVDLRESDLADVSLVDADLRDAHLNDASLRDADLSRAKLHGADLRGADLTGAVLRDAEADATTVWPKGFDPHEAGVNFTAR